MSIFVVQVRLDLGDGSLQRWLAKIDFWNDLEFADVILTYADRNARATGYGTLCGRSKDLEVV